MTKKFEYAGYWVWCFQRFKEENAKNPPFAARIVEDHGTHWQLKLGKSVLKAHKGACSTVPFKNKKEAESKAYRNEVEKKSPTGLGPKKRTPPKNQSVDTPTVGSPKRKPRVSKKPAKTSRPKRPGNSQNTRPTRAVRRKTPIGIASSFSARSKKSS